MNEHPIKHPPLFTKDEVVKDILENMNIDEKAKLKHTPKEDLVMFHRGWGTYLRNYYQMWHNPDLLKSIGIAHPDDASAVIIEEVWNILQKSEEPGLESPPEPPEIGKNVSFRWHVDKECLEITTSGGTSIVIEAIDLEFAQAIAESMKTNILQMRTSYLHPDVAPKTTYTTPNAVVSLRKYPKYRDDGEIKTAVFVEWLVNEQRFEFSCGGVILAIECIDLDLAQAIAKALKTGLPEVERYTAADVAPRVENLKMGVVIKLWEYPQHPDNQPGETAPLGDDPVDENSQGTTSATRRALERFKRIKDKLGF